MPATAAAKGKGAASKPLKRRTDEAPLATLVARLPRADLEALLLSLEEQVDLRSAIEAKLEPEQVRQSRRNGSSRPSFRLFATRLGWGSGQRLLCLSFLPLRELTRYRPQRKKARVAHGSVGASESLVNDGPFADLDGDLILKILCAGDDLELRRRSFLDGNRELFGCGRPGLDTLSKLAFTGCVCKGLRSLRSKPDLWHKVKLEGG